MTRLLLLVTGLVLLLGGGVATAAPVDVPQRLERQIARADRVGIPVLLPSRIDDADVRLFPQARIRRDRYTLALHGSRDCTANVCFLNEFVGERGNSMRRTNVRLARGIRGLFTPLSCGASCAPASITWAQGGNTYAIATKASSKRRAFVRLANSAIRGGDRR